MPKTGYTLIEVVVVLTIIGILLAILTVAVPPTRQSQDLLVAEQIVQATIRDAQQRAHNELREAGCLASAAVTQDETLRTRCSDIGVAFRSGELVLFADVSGTNYTYSPEIDYTIKRVALPGVTGAEGLPDTDYVFRGEPPLVKLYLRSGGTSSAVRLTSSSQSITLEIQPYGQVVRR